MNSKSLNDLRQDFLKLEYSDDKEFDKLCRRIKLLIVKFFGENSHYLTDWNRISFVSLFSETDEENRRDWQHGLDTTINLIDTMKEDLNFIDSISDSHTKPQFKIVDLHKSAKVFIVHGHDSLAKTEVALFLQRLGLEPIILHEQVNSGKTIIEKIEANTDVGFGIVLYTPCDLGKAKDSETLNQRARQNVVFEHGFLIGKLGRDKVLALVKGSIEYPSDISGVVYETMDSNNGWHLKLAKELKTAGYDIDLNKVI